MERIFTDVGVEYNTRVLINLYRRGRKQKADKRGPGTDKARPRPIIVVFLRHLEKAQFFGGLKNLQGNETWKNVYIFFFFFFFLTTTSLKCKR